MLKETGEADSPFANCIAAELHSRRKRIHQYHSGSSNGSDQVPGARSSTSNVCYQDRHPQAASTAEAAKLYPIAIRADFKHSIIYMPVFCREHYPASSR